MRLPNWGLIGMLCLHAVAAACAKPATQKLEPPKPPVTALAWLSADAQIIARVTLAPWRNTPLWSIWQENHGLHDAWPSWVDVALVDELTVGGALYDHGADGVPQKGSFVAALKGRFGEGYLAKLAVNHGAPVDKRGAWTFYAVNDARWLQTAADVIVVCSRDRADFVAARATEGGETVQADSRSLMRSLAERVDFARADLAVMAEDSSGEGKRELEKRGAPLGLSPLARDLVRAGVSVDLGSTVQLLLVAEAIDAESAQRLKLNVDETLSVFSRDMIVALLGVRPLIRALKADHEGVHVTVRGALPEADVMALLSKTASMLQVALQGGRVTRPAP